MCVYTCIFILIQEWNIIYPKQLDEYDKFDAVQQQLAEQIKINQELKQTLKQQILDAFDREQALQQDLMICRETCQEKQQTLRAAHDDLALIAQEKQTLEKDLADAYELVASCRSLYVQENKKYLNVLKRLAILTLKTKCAPSQCPIENTIPKPVVANNQIFSVIPESHYVAPSRFGFVYNSDYDASHFSNSR